MITATGITETCAVCLEDIESTETVYVHDKNLHPLHPDCYNKWKKTCTVNVTCPSCKKVIEVAAPVLGTDFLAGPVVPAELRALYDTRVNIGPPLPSNPLGWMIWKLVRQCNSYLAEHIVPEVDTPGREAINLLRNYLNANVGQPGKALEVNAVVNLFGLVHRWPSWYATKLAAERGDIPLLDSIHCTGETPILALESLLTTGQRELAGRVIPWVYLNEGLRYFASTGLREGVRICLERGPLRLTSRAKAIKTALSHGHCLIALDILFRSSSRINTITPY